MGINWFNERKAAQVAAFFARKQGGQIDVLKLVKLIYLADRKNMERHGFPILNDRFVSMPHGPVNSITYNYIDGNFDETHQWDQYLSDRSGYRVGTVREFNDDDFDELSDVEIASLDLVWNEFGHMSKWQIRDWTHENCPEWEDPEGSAEPIPHKRVFKFLRCENAEGLAGDVQIERNIDELFAQLRG